MSRSVVAIVVAALLTVVGFVGLTAGRPDPSEVVRAKILASAEDLTTEASTALSDAEDLEAARGEVADPHPFEIYASRTTADNTTEWDVELRGGASAKFMARGRWEKFHACFRLSGTLGQDNQVTRREIDCPMTESRDGSTLITLD